MQRSLSTFSPLFLRLASWFETQNSDSLGIVSHPGCFLRFAVPRLKHAFLRAKFKFTSCQLWAAYRCLQGGTGSRGQQGPGRTKTHSNHLATIRRKHATEDDVAGWCIRDWGEKWNFHMHLWSPKCLVELIIQFKGVAIQFLARSCVIRLIPWTSAASRTLIRPRVGGRSRIERNYKTTVQGIGGHHVIIIWL